MRQRNQRTFPLLSRCSFFVYSAKVTNRMAHFAHALRSRFFSQTSARLAFVPENSHARFTHILAIPAFLTAELTAFTAVCMLFNSCVRSPVAAGTLRCSASTNLVKVMQSESMIVFFDAIVTVSCLFERRAEREETSVRERGCPVGD